MHIRIPPSTPPARSTCGSGREAPLPTLSRASLSHHTTPHPPPPPPHAILPPRIHASTAEGRGITFQRVRGYVGDKLPAQYNDYLLREKEEAAEAKAAAKAARRSGGGDDERKG